MVYRPVYLGYELLLPLPVFKGKACRPDGIIPYLPEGKFKFRPSGIILYEFFKPGPDLPPCICLMKIFLLKSCLVYISHPNSYL